jgi:toxin HigB-1
VRGPGCSPSSMFRLPILSDYCTIWRVIRSFADRDTERLFRREWVRRWGPGLQTPVTLDAAVTLEDLGQTPGNRLEKLRGDRAGQWSIRVNASGGSASGGRRMGPMRWKWSIITEGSNDEGAAPPCPGAPG